MVFVSQIVATGQIRAHFVSPNDDSTYGADDGYLIVKIRSRALRYLACGRTPSPLEQRAITATPHACQHNLKLAIGCRHLSSRVFASKPFQFGLPRIRKPPTWRPEFVILATPPPGVFPLGNVFTHSATPLVFDCHLRPQVWGGRRLASFLRTSPPDDRAIGEAWVLSSHPLHVSQIVSGTSAGMRLTEFHERFSQELLGDASQKTGKFPWLVKFLDCHEMLSVQVHPSDELALRWSPGERGKTEAWVILGADRGASIYAGLKNGVTKSVLTKALDNGTVAECLHRIKPRPGDCIFLPAGTVHAVGGGVLMAEVQQSSDATFRLFDWNRLCADGQPRQLHRTEALDCIDWHRGPVRPQVPTRLRNLPAGVAAELLIDCPHFCMNRYRLDRNWQPNPTGELTAWIVLDGQIEISADIDSSIQTVSRGGAILIPAATTNYCLRPLGPATLLQVTTGSPASATARAAA